MSATVHSINKSAAAPPAAASGPAGETPAPLSELADTCAWAAQTALKAHHRMEDAMYAAEYALDEAQRTAKALARAEAQLTAAILEVRKSARDLTNVASVFIDRMPKKLPEGAVSVLKAPGVVPTGGNSTGPEATEETGDDRPAAPLSP